MTLSGINLLNQSPHGHFISTNINGNAARRQSRPMPPIGYTAHPMDEIQIQLAVRDRLMRTEAKNLTPEQRMERFEALQQYSFELLRQNPQAWDRFWRRNLKKRAVAPNPALSK